MSERSDEAARVPLPVYGRHRKPRRVRQTHAAVTILRAGGPIVLVILLIGVLVIPRQGDGNASPRDSHGDISSPSLSTSGPTSPKKKRPGAAAAGAPTTTDNETAGSSVCPSGGLIVAAAPEIAPLIETVTASTSNSCHITVIPMDSADLVASWQSPGATRPDVWVPDSSYWIAEAALRGLPVSGQPPSLATSPVVLALAASTAKRLSADPIDIAFEQILATRSTAAPIRLGLANPLRSIETVSALASIRSAVAGRPGARAALTWAMRSTPANLPDRDDLLLAHLGRDPQLAVPVSEQAVWAHNARRLGIKAVAVYSSSSGMQLNYPFMVMKSTPAAQSAAANVLIMLESPSFRQLLFDNGFRDARGVAGGHSAQEFSAVPAERTNVSVPTPAVVDDTIHALNIIGEPSRLLAVVDVSGSMAQLVPGTAGATRLDLAKTAAIRGISLYSQDSQVGLWVFSRDLTAHTDFDQVLPLGALGGTTDGRSGRHALANALSAIEVNPDGGTGLYDTTLAAVRTMRAQWDRNRVNAVLILSDGQNDDWGSISLSDLLMTLKSEQDLARPVPVIAIAFGPDSDVRAMRQISLATGGTTYVARDPRDIGEIFLDAVGQRLCRPRC